MNRVFGPGSLLAGIFPAPVSVQPVDTNRGKR